MPLRLQGRSANGLPFRAELLNESIGRSLVRSAGSCPLPVEVGGRRDATVAQP